MNTRERLTAWMGGGLLAILAGGLLPTRAYADATPIPHSCTIRASAEPWSNDPLRGGCHIRLSAVDVPATDLGVPARAAVAVTPSGTGTGTVGADVTPADRWSSTWRSDRWLWTAGDGALAALAAVGGYCLTRGSGRPRRVPPEV